MKASRTLAVCLCLASAVVTTALWWPSGHPGASSSRPASARDGKREAAKADLPPGTIAAPSPDSGKVTPEMAEEFGAWALAQARQPDMQPIAAFDGWIQRWKAASPGERKALVAEGARLAAARREEFKALIATDPRRALEEAVPRVVRQELPKSIVDSLETPVSTKGDYNVYMGRPAPGLEAPADALTLRYFEADGVSYKARVFGQMNTVMSKPAIPLGGVAVDREFAVAESPLRQLEVGEIVPSGTTVQSTCPVSGNTTTAVSSGEAVAADTPTVEVGGEFITLCNGSHVTVLDDSYRTAIQASGPGGATSFVAAYPGASAKSIGDFHCLYIRVTYPDQMVAPNTEDTAYADMANNARYYLESSYGKMTQTSVFTPVVVMPHTLRWYLDKDGEVDGLGLVHSDARAEAKKLGYDSAQFTCTIVRVNGGPKLSGTSWGGGNSVWITWNGMDVLNHECGHSLGRNHANYWNATDGTPYGDGSNSEYGNSFDVMGGAYGFSAHYNAYSKRALSWLPDSYVNLPKGNGVFRIYAYDQPRLEEGKRYALAVAKDSIRSYNLEYHPARGGLLADSALVLYTGMGSNAGHLLDTTQGSPGGKGDGGIAVGRTYSDFESDQHFTVLSKNATTPPSLDIAYNRGPFPGNLPPTVTLATSGTTISVGGSVTFTATASDPNGDALAYQWDFSDGVGGTNSSSVSRTFSAAAQVTALLTVSDMKGGTARRSVVVNVGSHGKQSITGTVTNGGNPLAGVLITGNGKYCYTDVDGTYTLAGVATGAQTLAASLPGYAFTPSTANPYTVIAGTNTVDWTAAASTFVTLTKVADATEGGSNGTFRLTRTGSTAADLVVRVSPVGGTAVKTTDYTFSPDYVADGSYKTFTIPAGSATLDVTVAAVNDTAAEGPETITLQLASNGDYISGSGNSVVMTVVDNDTTLPQVAVTAPDPHATEDSSGTDTGTFTFSRTGATTSALNLTVAWSGGATNGTDYTTLATTVTIPSGQSSVNVTVSPINDSAIEGPETVIATISANAAYVLDTSATTSTVTITDDDVPVVTVTVPDASASESGPDSGMFLITRTGSTAAELKVYYGLSGSALQGVDYAPLSGEVVIPAGSSTASVVVTPYNDANGEQAETVTLAVTTFDNDYSVGTDFQGTVTITDNNDPPLITVRASSAGTEGGSNPSVIFRAIGSGSGNVTVNYTVSGTATAGSDYTALSGSVSVPANGANEVSVPISIIDDGSAEPTETVVVTITPSAAYTVYNESTATALIRDNDSGGERVMVSNYNTSAAEGGSTGTFYFSRAGTTGALTVNYTLSGTATNGTDYSSLSGSVVIPDGEQGVNVVVTPTDDATAEGTETVIATVASGTGYSVDVPASATIEIADNDASSVTVGFQAATMQTSEQPGGLGEYRDIPVVLSASSASTITVNYIASGGTASGDDVDWSFADAANGNAFLPTGTLTFAPGVTTRNIRIRVKNDGVTEIPETAVIELRAPNAASLATNLNKMTVLIYDDTAPPVVLEQRWSGSTAYNTNTWTAVPSYSGFLYSFTPAQNVADSYSRRLVGQIVAPTTGTYNFWIASDDGSRLYLSTDSTAANKSQIATVTSYTGFQSWDTYAAQKSANITLTAGQSYYMEVQHLEGSGNDHVSVAWQGPSFSRTPIAFTLPDTAPRTVRLALAASTRLESDGSEPMLFASLDRPTGSTPVTVNYASSGTATNGSDYSLTGGTLTFTAGEQSKAIPLTLLTDAVNEAPETIVVTLSGPSGATLATPSSHTITLIDANAPAVTAAAFNANAAQSASTVIGTVSATPASGRSIASWTIQSGNTGSVFAINSSGQVSLAAPGSLTVPGTSYTLVVRATDNLGAASDGTVTVTVQPGNGTWTNLSGGSWATTGNWSGGLIATGVGGTADFSTLNLTADATVTLDGARTIGNLTFNDTTASNNWTLNTGSGGPLTLDVTSGTPTVTVTNQTATLGVALAGSEGWAKTGAGKLTLTGTNTVTGGVNLNGSGLVTLGGTNAANIWSVPNGQYTAGLLLNSNTTIASGSMLNTSSNSSFPAGLGVANGVTVGGGSTINFNGASGRATYNLGTGSVLAANTVNNGTNPLQIVVGSGSQITGNIDLDGGQLNIRNDFTAMTGVTKNNTGVFTISGNISGTNASGINTPNTFTGTYVLTGANDFTGTTAVSGYTLSFNSVNNVGGGASALGAPATVAAGTIAIGSSTTGGTIVYTGSGSTSDRVINLAGTTGGAIVDQSGTGLLKFSGGVTATGAGVKTLTLRGSTAGAGEIGGVIANSTSTTAVTKTGTGAWTLSGANTYTGATTVSAGTLLVNGSIPGTVTVASGATLGGTGTLASALTIPSGATLAPGAGGTGTLSVNNTLSLAGTTVMEVSKSGATLTNDKVTGVSTLTCGGTLTVTNAGPDALAAGNTFQLFSATTYSGTFTTVNLPTLTGGLVWNSSKLYVTGTISVNTPPSFPSDPINGGSVAQSDAYTGTLASVASDPDAGDVLTFSKVSGPSWLSVASNGALSGTPASGDVGTNAFSVKVTDALGTYGTATLNITVTSLPPGFTGADIGTTGITGSSSYSAGVYTISGGGADIWSTADGFQYAYRSYTGDFDIRARVASQTATHTSCKAGVMIRNSLAADSVNAMMEITPSNDAVFQYRSTAGGSSSSVHGPATNTAPNNWVRLVRIGTSFTAFYSVDGTAWNPIGTATLTMGSTVYTGLAVSSHVSGTLSTATFDNVSTTAVDLPSPWVTTDIGTTGLTGSAFRLNGVFQNTGAGVIGSTADGLRFTYQALTADGDITVRVPAFTNSGSSSRLGVMIRDTLSADSRHVFLGTDASGAFTWTRRTAAGGSTSTSNSGTATAPNVWVRLVRSGNDITAYSSADGSSWTNIGTVTMTLSTNCYIGLASGSGTTTTLTTASFDNITVNP